MAGSVDSLSAWPDAAVAPRRWGGRILIAVGAALAAAAVTALVLPGMTFRARSVVAITDPLSPLALFLPKTAAEATVSKPVMRRAAESLIETGLPAPAPDAFERLALVAHLDGAQATATAARLADGLSQIVTSQPGALPGTLEISATDGDPERAARITSAVAEALIAEQDDDVAKSRRSRDVDTASRVERLRGEAAAARHRLAALGGAEVDPAQARSAAAAQTAAAQARADAIHAILASGSPPLSDRRDVSTAIDALQTSYLDLSRQLAKARETLGDRHTTIISLQAEVKHAAASLAAEWRRLGKLAENDLAAARGREASLRKTDSAADANRRAAIDEARRSVQAADDAVARAPARTGAAATDEPAYRLLLRPVVPSVSFGLSTPMRGLLCGLVGVLAFMLALALPKRGLASIRPRLTAFVRKQELPQNKALRVAGTPAIVSQPSAEGHLHPPASLRSVPKVDRHDELTHSLYDLLPELRAIVPAFGPIPTLMIAANEADVGTTRVALSLGRALAQHGHRVLVVEATRPQPELAAAASEDVEPILIDLGGVLRVALRADVGRGVLYLAPGLEHGDRIAGALARGSETPIVDDIGASFDLIIIDGGEARACAAEGWGADAYLRVGRSESRRADAELTGTFDVPQDMLVGTIVSTTLRRPDKGEAGPALRPAAASQVAQRAAQTLRPQPRRAVRPAPAARRKIGGR